MRSLRRHGAWILPALILAAGLPGCAANNFAPGEASKASSTDDPFRPYQEVASVMLRRGGFLDAATLQMLGRRDRKSGHTTTHALIRLYYFSERAKRLNSARSERSEPLGFHVLAKLKPKCRADGCQYTEELLVDIPETHLRASRETGYRFKMLSLSSPEVLISVPPPLIVAVLDGLDRLKAPPPMAATATKH